MKILFCIGCMNKGGAERVMANLANYFSIENDVVIVISSNDDSKYELSKHVDLLKLDKEKFIKNGVIRNIKRITMLKKIIKNFKPDIIISFLPEPSFRVLFIKTFCRICPVIVSVRNDPKVEYKNLFNRIIMKILYPFADGFVFQTEEAQQYFSKKKKKKSVIIPNPLKEEFVTRKKYKGIRDKIIVNVGRLEEQKNHELLIDAYKDLENEIDGYKLIIYGEGTLREKLENKIKELDLEKKVILFGEVQNIPEKIEKASLFVLTSRFEGMPNALMEAMALGLPCIATDCPCGGVRKLIINKENGIVIKNNDLSELKNAIRYVINNPKNAEKLGIEAQKICVNMNPEKINGLWENYIQSIKNRRKK